MHVTAWLTLALLMGTGPWRLDSSAAVPPSDGAELAIIVHRTNTLDNLSIADLRRAFAAERQRWPNGRKVTIVMRNPGDPARESILRLLLGMSEQDFQAYLLRQNFTGEVSRLPKLVSTPDAMREFVFNVPGAIGYVRRSEVDATVKVLRVDGYLPGEPGYPLHVGARRTDGAPAPRGAATGAAGGDGRLSLEWSD